MPAQAAMILDFLPYKIPSGPRKKAGWIRYITLICCIGDIMETAPVQIPDVPEMSPDEINAEIAAARAERKSGDE